MTQSTHVENPAVSLEALSDDQLLRQIESLSRAEHAAMIHVLHHLNEIERRRLHLDLGYRSMFDYCIRSLEYSPAAAGRRIQAARCIRRFPAVLPLLREREINLSVISLIEPVLTIDNFKTILEQVRGALYRDVERLASEYRPPVAFRDRVRPVRVAMPQEPEVAAPTKPDQEVLTPDVGSEDKKVRIEQKLLVQFLASEDLMEKIEEARALLSNRCPTDRSPASSMHSSAISSSGTAPRNARREEKTETEPPLQTLDIGSASYQTAIVHGTFPMKSEMTCSCETRANARTCHLLERGVDPEKASRSIISSRSQREAAATCPT